MNTKLVLAVITISLLILPAATAFSFEPDTLSEDLKDKTEELEETIEEEVEQKSQEIEILDEKTIRGILIPSDETINLQTDNLPVEIPKNSYILVSEDSKHIVFTHNNLQVGEYTLEGKELPKHQLQDREYSIIIAEQAEQAEPIELNIEEVKHNIQDYHYKEIKTGGVASKASASIGYNGIETPLTLGFLTEEENYLEKNFRQQAEQIAQDFQWQPIKNTFEVQEKTVPLIDPRYSYWTNTETEIKGVVLPIEDYDLLEDAETEIPQSNQKSENREFIYIREKNYSSTKTQISEIHGLEEGKNIETTGEGILQEKSIQKLTSATTGTNIPVDLYIQAGILKDPASGEKVVVHGITSESNKLDLKGRYKIKGTTISGKIVDESSNSQYNSIWINKLEKQSRKMPNLEIENAEEMLENIIEGNQIEYSEIIQEQKQQTETWKETEERQEDLNNISKSQSEDERIRENTDSNQDSDINSENRQSSVIEKVIIRISSIF